MAYNAHDYPRQDDMELPILGCIAEMGGEIVFSSQGSQIEEKLAEHFRLSDAQRTRTDPSCNAKGRRVWRNHIQYARQKMVESRVLEGERNIWRVTSKGYERLSRDEQFLSRDGQLKVAISDGGRTIRLVADSEESSFPEGKAKYRFHRILERDKRIVQLAKLRRLTETGRLECDVCTFDFHEWYGDIAEGFIEAHHTTPVSELIGTTRTKLSDLALVCCNCHRMLHLARPWLTVSELKTRLREFIDNGSWQTWQQRFFKR